MNEDKTQVIFITNRRTRQLPHRPFRIDTTEIEWTNTVKYLGAIPKKTRKLTFRQHIQTVLQKTHIATKILNSSLNRKSRLNIDKILLCKACLRLIFAYATPASQYPYRKTPDLPEQTPKNGTQSSLAHIHS